MISSLYSGIQEAQTEDLLLPLVEKLKREREKLSAVIDSFNNHCKTSNVKPTKWEETLTSALRESNQMIQTVGAKVDQLRLENTVTQTRPFAIPTSVSQNR